MNFTAFRSKRGARLGWVFFLTLLFSPVPSPGQQVLEAEEETRLKRPTPGLKVARWKPVPQARKNEMANRIVGGAYTASGPGPATGGQVEGMGAQSSPVTGAVEAFAVHPTDPDQIWLGAVNGGIFYTTNATAGTPTWTAQGDAFASLSIGAIELDPTDTSDPRTLVAGIGRTSSFSGIGGIRTGVLRTTDSGSTWTLLPGMAGRQISGLAARGSTIVASVNTADSFITTEVGIFRSTDTGASWTQINAAGGVGTGLPLGVCNDLAEDPTDSTRLFTVLTLASGSEGIYRSTDTGATWTKVSNMAIDTDLASVSRVELAVGNAGGASANVFVAIVSSGALSGLHLSSDAGGTWTALDLPMTTEVGGGGGMVGIHPGGQGSIHLSLAAHPTDHDVCFIGGDRQPAGFMDLGGFPNSIGASDFSGRIFRVDGGATPGSQATHLTHSNTTGGSSPHADSREMRFDSNGDLIESDDGGIYKHGDPDLTTGDWISINGDLPVNEQHDMAYDPVSDIIFSGNQDTGTTGQTSTASTTWTSYLTADGGDVVVAPNDTVVGNSMRYFSFQFLGSPTRREFTSANGIVGTTSLTLTPLGGDPAVSAAFYTPLATNGGDPTRLIIGAANGVYESMDRGGSVSRISMLAVNSFGRNAIAYGTTGNNDALYFGSDDDVFVRTAAPPAAPAMSAAYAATAGTVGDTVVAIAVDPDDAMTAFVIDTDQVFQTTDAGASWTDITDNLFTTFTPGTLRSIAYLNGNPGMDGLAVGGSTGVYVALENAGTPFTTWDSLGTGLPNAPVYDLRFSNSDDLLVAGTLGRGAFVLTPVISLLPVELLSFEIE